YKLYADGSLSRYKARIIANICRSPHTLEVCNLSIPSVSTGTFVLMDKAAVRRLLKDHSDVIHAELHAQLAALHMELQAIKSLGINQHVASSDMRLPRFMRLEVVGFNLEGDVAEWFHWMSRNNLTTDLEWFLESVHNRFGPCLKPSLQRELLVSKPTTLGDAFSLACVIEARLEDQGVSSVSSKAIANNGNVLSQKGTTLRFTFPPQEQVKPALVSTPSKPDSKACTTPLPIKWILLAERQERLSKGLCFNYGSKRVRCHKCHGKFLLLMADEDVNAD
nr:hypothetical protein [Tanacetum cinerariifolium]